MRLPQPAYYFSYVLQFRDDGTFYVGSTNAPIARWTEHAAGIGARATSDRSFIIRMAMPFLTRREAEYNEKRMQEALARSPRHMEALVEAFDQMSNVVRPPKTFSQLHDEEQRYIREMNNVFHHSTATISSRVGSTACGWSGPFYSTQDWDTLKKMARDEDLTGNVYGRKVCRRCIDHAPEE